MFAMILLSEINFTAWPPFALVMPGMILRGGEEGSKLI